jgi:phosphate transport system substrate-binding protein
MWTNFITPILRISPLLALSTILILGAHGCNSQSQNQSQSQKQSKATIKLGGSSSAIGLLKDLSASYRAKAPSTALDLLEPGQSENVIAGVKQKIIDVAAISKNLTPEKSVGSIVSREVAHDGLLVATHESVRGIAGVTTDQLKDIYSGKVTNWKELGGPDAPIVLLDRPEDESTKKLLRKHYLGADLKNSPNAVILRKEGELIQALENTPYSIGAFSLAHAISNKISVNRLSLNNIPPNTETIKNGTYPMVRTLSLIWNQSPSAATQEFVTYVGSPEGKQAIETSGFVAITK